MVKYHLCEFNYDVNNSYNHAIIILLNNIELLFVQKNKIKLYVGDEDNKSVIELGFIEEVNEQIYNEMKQLLLSMGYGQSLYNKIEKKIKNNSINGLIDNINRIVDKYKNILMYIDNLVNMEKIYVDKKSICKLNTIKDSLNSGRREFIYDILSFSKDILYEYVKNASRSIYTFNENERLKALNNDYKKITRYIVKINEKIVNNCDDLNEDNVNNVINVFKNIYNNNTTLKKLCIDYSKYLSVDTIVDNCLHYVIDKWISENAKNTINKEDLNKLFIYILHNHNISFNDKNKYFSFCFKTGFDINYKCCSECESMKSCDCNEDEKFTIFCGIHKMHIDKKIFKLFLDNGLMLLSDEIKSHHGIDVSGKNRDDIIKEIEQFL
jgi:hypothetical protein